MKHLYDVGDHMQFILWDLQHGVEHGYELGTHLFTWDGLKVTVRGCDDVFVGLRPLWGGDDVVDIVGRRSEVGAVDSFCNFALGTESVRSQLGNCVLVDGVQRRRRRRSTCLNSTFQIQLFEHVQSCSLCRALGHRFLRIIDGVDLQPFSFVSLEHDWETVVPRSDQGVFISEEN
ncbi:hypothetical protein WICPIJ_004073 [Wickerhamomyces pijperi]|uniref:Uncharacterized protein n=1 Tax=Wickerhamomyces pijperi TaxID=599730 RepID=A0A9P8Q5Z5_WICPI|nr:hypothetical protein WICPIJ_004073 [Wickerhamomyces pijperi]